jgi:hypothetical protein
LLFERRQEGDYEEFVTFKAADVKPWLKETQHFIDSAITLIK